MASTPCHAGICVVVLTHNRRDTLRRTLQHLLTLPERPRIAVVDNGSGDGTAAMLRQAFPGVACLRSDINLGAAGRNLGAQWASDVAGTPYVAFCDDDCWWHDGSLARARALLDANAGVVSLTARILVGADNREDPASTHMARSPLPSADLPGRAILGFMAGATVFRVRAFLAAGGYDPRFFIGGEEAALALQLAGQGWLMVYVPELVVHHHPSPQRDAASRRSLLARNAVWTSWLCLPAPMAIGDTVRAIPALARHLDAAGWRELARGMRWVLRERRVVDDRVVAAVRLTRQRG
ncbi:glycosyltransferase family 2 protein [Cupriavidus sp. H18C2]|uniref:glycosyltransferase family 2 protein n=1 Tax=Cupriavidus sp. H18C2 TaxID=3241602 RepID=UPI003BF8885E